MGERTYTKGILAYSRNNHYLSSNRLIAINSIGDGDGRNADDLDTDEAKPEDYDDLPGPVAVVAHSDYMISSASISFSTW